MVGVAVDARPPVHANVVAVPLTVKSAVVPEQIVGELTDTVGAAFTVTVDTAVAVHSSRVPVTVYVVVVVKTPVVGLATAAKPPVQLYDVELPLAIGCAVLPEHIAGEVTFTVGNGFTRIDFVAATLALPDL